MDAIEQALDELFEKASKLEKLLEPFEEEISDCCHKPLKEMGVSDKIKLAKLLITVYKRC